ncbi:MAG: alternative ribosome rescue aminoacyl-tRNA hydrolase ArfB [Anditalea sp.]
MNRIEQIRNKDLAQECIFAASRSSGAGGQNVNKVNTKITLRFDVKNSALLAEEEKEIIIRKLGSKISGDGILVITAQKHRSQLQNKEEALFKFNQLLKKAFTFKKIRKASKPSKGAIKRRLDDKRRQSEKKKWRQKD